MSLGFTTGLHSGFGTGRNLVAQDHLLFFRCGVIDDRLEQEPVHLRFGQGIGAFLLDRVLGGQHQKGLGQRKGLGTNGDLPFLHGFEQGALHFGRRAVDLVCQDKVGKNGPLADGELLLLLVVDHGAHNICREQVRGELDTAKVHVHRPAQRLDRQGLGQAGNTFEEDVSVGQESGKQGVDHVALAHQGLADLMPEFIHKAAGDFDALGQRLDVRTAIAVDDHIRR